MATAPSSKAPRGASADVAGRPDLLDHLRQAAPSPHSALRLRGSAEMLYEEASSLGAEKQSALCSLLSSCISEGKEIPGRSASGEPDLKRPRLQPKETSGAEHTSCSPRDEKVEEWLPLLLAAALPSLKGALPKDERGLSVLPHPHEMKKKTMRNARCWLKPSGGVVFDTKRACDNCDKPIEERTWYACAECEVDFCLRCHKGYQKLFAGRDPATSLRAADVVEHAAAVAMASGAASRRALVEAFAFEWPHEMFQDLVRATADVANAKLVHVEDGHNMDLSADLSFWRIMAFLQLLRCANERPSQEIRFGELTPRGPRLSEAEFVLGGIDKCDAQAEYLRWREGGAGASKAVAAAVLDDEKFEVTASFALFLAHVDLVPLGFRQRCLHTDMAEMVSRARLFRRRVQPLAVRVPRSPQADLCAETVRQLAGVAAPRPLLAKFSGERGSGPGVTKEFLALAMEALLTAKIGEGYKEGAPAFEYDPESRTYWFSDGANSVPELFQTVGVVLAQALLIGTQLQVSLPPLFYSLLLRELGAAVPALGLADLAALKPSLAKGLQELLDYEGSDVAEVFPLDWPRSQELTTKNRAEYVKDYVQWFMQERFQAQMSPLAKAFCGVLGRSHFLKTQVSATQLEQILCGFEEPLDVEIVRQSAAVSGFSKEEEERFWRVLGGFDAGQRRAFAVFVSACARRPPEGWQRLELKVQRNGDGDERLPTAFTCYTLLLLPRYSSEEVLRSRLLAAISETEGFGLS